MSLTVDEVLYVVGDSVIESWQVYLLVGVYLVMGERYSSSTRFHEKVLAVCACGVRCGYERRSEGA